MSLNYTLKKWLKWYYGLYILPNKKKNKVPVYATTQMRLESIIRK